MGAKVTMYTLASHSGAQISEKIGQGQGGRIHNFGPFFSCVAIKAGDMHCSLTGGHI
jgi:hypothetical protein